jgi:cell division protease FtsH
MQYNRFQHFLSRLTSAWSGGSPRSHAARVEPRAALIGAADRLAMAGPDDSSGGSNSGGSNSGGPNSGKPGMPQQNGGRQVMGWIMFGAVILLLFLAFGQSGGGQQELTWSQFKNLAESKALEGDSVNVNGAATKVTATVKETSAVFPGKTVYVNVMDKQDYWVKDLTDAKVDFKKVEESYWPVILVQLLPVILIIGIIWFIARQMRGAGGGPGGMLGNFGKSRHRMQSKDTVKVTFNDVAGVDEAKEEVQEIVEFLKNPKRFSKLGGRIPRGVLLSGPPGCGKTLLAKAIAGEAGVPFYSISGSDFVEMFVGVGASRVRDLFKQAKENSPCIVFLDEIDAVGRRRGGGFSSGGHDEREQTLNAILVEMDGFDANTQVIVIASTNRPDVLDPALTRPGRFDRSVAVNLPDLAGRRQILAVHAKKVKLAEDVDLEKVARGTPMFSGADLAALINEAAIIATMADKDFVELADLEEARDKVRWGRANRSRKIEQQERVATAYHEAGHAVLQMLLEHADPLHKVTIIPRGQAMGATFSLPEKDRYGYGRKHIMATLRVLCGGRLAEERKTGDTSSGASMDIRMVTSYARAMILQWGMSERLGFVNYAGSEDRESIFAEKDYSPETARVIDEEIRRMSDEAYEDARRLLDLHWDKVVAVAEALLKYETLQRDDIDRLMRGESIGKPTVADLLIAENTRPKLAEPKPETRVGEDPDAGLSGAMPSPA